MKLLLKVVPGAQRTEVVGLMENGILKVRVQAPPEKGKANEELVRFFAEALSMPRADISVIRGKGARDKVMGLPDGARELLQRLGWLSYES